LLAHVLEALDNGVTLEVEDGASSDESKELEAAQKIKRKKTK